MRASGGSTSERRYAVRIVPLFPGTGGRWLHIVTALQIAALLSGSRGGQRGESFCERRYAVRIVPLFPVQADNGLHMATALQIAALLSGSRGGQRDG